MAATRPTLPGSLDDPLGQQQQQQSRVHANEAYGLFEVGLKSVARVHAIHRKVLVGCCSSLLHYIKRNVHANGALSCTRTSVCVCIVQPILCLSRQRVE